VKKDVKDGYALVSVLVISFCLFWLVSLALSANYFLHRLNRRFEAELQERASGIGPAAGQQASSAGAGEQNGFR